MIKTKLIKQEKYFLEIPAKIVSEMGITEDSELALVIEGGKLVIQKQLTLEEMVATITDENRQELIDFGPPVGRELI